MSLAAALKSQSNGVLVRGLLAVLVGVLALASPLAAALTLTLLFACFVIVEGVLAVAAGWSATPREWALVLLGALGVVVGLIGAFQPGLLALTLITGIGVWAIVRGVLEIALALRLRREIRGEGWMMLSGALSIAFGALVVGKPLVGLIAEAALFGIYCLVLGIALIALSMRLRRLPAA
jgi:uncharacterized membrane protein HdeD (DUF308 family)